MNNHEEAFAEKIQRLRHTGVGGQTAPSYERFPTNNVSARKGEATYVNMKVDKGWVVANPVTKKGASQKNQTNTNNDGHVKVFALANMEKPKDEEKVVAPVVSTDTEESIIKEILALQRKLAALRQK